MVTGARPHQWVLARLHGQQPHVGEELPLRQPNHHLLWRRARPGCCGGSGVQEAAVPVHPGAGTSAFDLGRPSHALYRCHVLCFVWATLLMLVLVPRPMLCMAPPSYALYGSHVLCFVWVTRPMLCMGATSYALYWCHVLCFVWVPRPMFCMASMHRPCIPWCVPSHQYAPYGLDACNGLT